MRPSRWLLICLVSVLQLLTARGSAEDVYSPEQLARDQTLAARPLAGPGAAVGLGGAFILAAPITLLLGTLSTLDLSSCQGWLSDGTDEACAEEERRQERHEERVMNRVIGGSIASAVIGTGLLAFGVTRIIQIKRARRRVARFEGAAIAPRAQGVDLALRFRF